MIVCYMCGRRTSPAQSCIFAGKEVCVECYDLMMSREPGSTEPLGVMPLNDRPDRIDVTVEPPVIEPKSLSATVDLTRAIDHVMPMTYDMLCRRVADAFGLDTLGPQLTAYVDTLYQELEYRDVAAFCDDSLPSLAWRPLTDVTGTPTKHELAPCPHREWLGTWDNGEGVGAVVKWDGNAARFPWTITLLHKNAILFREPDWSGPDANWTLRETAYDGTPIKPYVPSVKPLPNTWDPYDLG